MTSQPVRARSRRFVWAWTVAAGLLCFACSGTPAPHGSPVLTQVYWNVGGTQYLVWSRILAPKLATSVPPLASQIDFVFDRRLDGDRIEDTVTVDGVVTTRPKATPPISVRWPDMADEIVTPPFKLDVAYNSVAQYGDQSSYVFARPEMPGFPSSATVTFNLDLSNLASSYGEPADAPSHLDVKTSAFAVSASNPAAGVAGSYELPLAFSNRLPAVSSDGTSPFIHVMSEGGTLLPYGLLADANVASTLYVAPAVCLAVWPAHTKVVVTVDPGFPDAFGGKLASGVAPSFTTGASSGSEPGTSCPAVDAGAPGDAASDGGASDGAAPDAVASDAALDLGADGASAEGGADGGVDRLGDAATD